MTKRFVYDIELNYKKYSYIALVFLFGLLMGIFVLCFSKKDNPSSSLEMMNALFLSAQGNEISSANLFMKTLFAHIKTLAVFLFARISGAAFFVITIICAISGYTFGYGTASLFAVYGIKAVFLLIFAILPPKLFTVSGYALLFSSSLQKRLHEARRQRMFASSYALSASSFLPYLLIFAGIVAEAYFAPFILRLISGLFL